MTRMLSHRSFALIFGLMAVLIMPLSISAQQPAPTVTDIPYPLTSQAGPWVILASSYPGPNGPEMARQLTVWLRKRGYDAYIYNRGEVLQQELEREYGNVLQSNNPDSRQRKKIKTEAEYAVMIGGFRNRDAASDALKGVKKLPMPELNLGENIIPYHTHYLRDNKNNGYKVVAVSPFETSFVVPNPLVPQEPAAQSDPFIKDLNDDEEYSLLKNKSSWTLLVRDYYGDARIQQGFGTGKGIADQLSMKNKDVGKALEKAGLQAHETARVLRLLTYDAYALHTRQASFVAIGGFDGPNDPRMVELVKKLETDPNCKALQLMSPKLALKIPRP